MYSWILLNKENVKSFHLMLTLMFWGRHCEIVRITYWESWQFLQSDQWRNPRTCHCPPASLWTPCACCRAGTENRGILTHGTFLTSNLYDMAAAHSAHHDGGDHQCFVLETLHNFWICFREVSEEVDAGDVMPGADLDTFISRQTVATVVSIYTVSIISTQIWHE